MSLWGLWVLCSKLVSMNIWNAIHHKTAAGAVRATEQACQVFACLLFPMATCSKYPDSRSGWGERDVGENLLTCSCAFKGQHLNSGFSFQTLSSYYSTLLFFEPHVCKISFSRCTWAKVQEVQKCRSKWKPNENKKYKWKAVCFLAQLSVSSSLRRPCLASNF